MSTWFVTGCSTGLGRALAEAGPEPGHGAAITAREPGSLSALNGAHPATALPLALDVTDLDQGTAVGQAVERSGGVDVAVDNAGYGYRAAVEEGDPADVDRLFATNVFGPFAVMKTVLPGIRARRSGAVVDISSVGAQVCPPGVGTRRTCHMARRLICGVSRSCQH